MSKNQNKAYFASDWYQHLQEEVGALITETRFNTQHDLIKSKHEIGKLIAENEKNAPVLELIHVLSRKLDVSTRTIEQTVQFYRYDPMLKTLEEGKNISWRKCLKRFQVQKEKVPCKHEHTKMICVCEDCGDKIIK